MGASQNSRITKLPNHKTPESQNSRSQNARITKLPNHKMPDQVNVIQINGVFSTFLLQTVLSQSGSYYLIETEVEPDIVLPVNIFRCVRPLMGIFLREISYS